MRRKNRAARMIRRTVGPKPSSALSRGDGPLLTGLALTVTSCAASAAESWLRFANTGTNVAISVPVAAW